MNIQWKNNTLHCSHKDGEWEFVGAITTDTHGLWQCILYRPQYQQSYAQDRERAVKLLESMFSDAIVEYALCGPRGPRAEGIAW